MGRRLALVLIVLVSLSSSCLMFIPSVRADVEVIQTSCGISVDNIIEGQPIVIKVQIFPAPPSGEVIF